MKMSLTLENPLQTLAVAGKQDLSLKFPYCSRWSDWTPKCSRTELILGHGSICYFKIRFFLGFNTRPFIHFYHFVFNGMPATILVLIVP